MWHRRMGAVTTAGNIGVVAVPQPEGWGMAVVLQHRVGRDAKGEVAHPQGSNVPARWRSRPVAAAQKEEGRKYET